MIQGKVSSATRICGTHAAAGLFEPWFVALRRERLCAAHLDGGLALLKLTRTEAGAEARVEISLRVLVREALDLDARAMILAHNHPGGSLTPSAADCRATRQLAEICRSLGIRLLDHLLFAGSEVVSFRELGLL